ncbi:MAG: heparan-alpha-glucosaminide N-acetyltransferase [Acidovorax sp.]|jgi:uncharacterized membrane protein|uniref:DUF1624 domain-containing protein n=1 Tax=Acidovorax sp. TaxID=1872122 RepID=UPI00261F68A1|nr:heparan-alpha-glucosaminide N-acetyltransferase [Acidovorax sp.]MDH4426874.1 heparan-alpha-glucosaminide N-acetyltransferase [Acidovorax sp.]
MGFCTLVQGMYCQSLRWGVLGTMAPFAVERITSPSNPMVNPSVLLASSVQGAATASPGQRYAAVDALRGVAMVWMTVFHFCFDLSHFGLWPQNFRADPFWTTQRTLIVSLFLFCAGLGQAIALHQGQSWLRFGRRWLQIAGCALLVTAGSLVMFPGSYIHFGVLHGMAIMLLIARVTSGWGRWLWLAGLVALALPPLFQQALPVAWPEAASVFNSRALNWVGLITRKPFTEDYVPVLPWLGVLWWGMASGQWLLSARQRVIRSPLPAGLVPLATLGRWSLSYYMLHQPVMIGLLMAWIWLGSR